MSAGGRLESNGVHAGDFGKSLFENGYDFQAALGKFVGLIRMRPGETLRARDEFIDARVVLHGAGSERIETEIDGVIPGGETSEVAEGFELADLRKIFDLRADMPFAKSLFSVDRRHIQGGKLITFFARRTLFK